jgi:hypothetical protein
MNYEGLVFTQMPYNSLMWLVEQTIWQKGLKFDIQLLQKWIFLFNASAMVQMLDVDQMQIWKVDLNLT